MSFCSTKYDVFMSFLGGEICAKNAKICDSEIQISRGYISGKTNGFKRFITG